MKNIELELLLKAGNDVGHGILFEMGNKVIRAVVFISSMKDVGMVLDMALGESVLHLLYSYQVVYYN